MNQRERKLLEVNTLTGPVSTLSASAWTTDATVLSDRAVGNLMRDPRARRPLICT